MELTLYIAFVLATIIMISLPGPSVLLTVAHSFAFGWRHAIATVAGATAGIAVQLTVAIIGLTSLLNWIAEAFEWLRWAGAAYLIYLGIKQYRNANEAIHFDTASVSKTNLFVQGLIITIPNPKSLIFIAAFLPQFIDITRPLALQFLLIVPTFLLITFIVTCFWAIAAGKIRGLIKNQKVFKALQQSAGGIMILSGAALALARRGN